MPLRMSFALVWAVIVAGCSGDGGGGGSGSGGGGGLGGVSGVLEQPSCTPGTFGVSGRLYFPNDPKIHTTLYPLAAVTASASSLSAALSPDGAIDFSWTSAAQGDSLSGSFRAPAPAGGSAKDWCIDDSSKIVVSGSAATLKLNVFDGPCPLPPDSGLAPPKPAVMDMLGCVDWGP
ncbi:MAG: hypothetical protein HS104_39520 [Polyangiaceae bacterium]|nr:hypothetical protein [Polyangiaceae bacterium]MCE7888524.1 hypothetical protein [Sorangiineae bacterium PRO1]MCL4755083.1 hypothetical protein [Myxococcales bacterium]